MTRAGAVLFSVTHIFSSRGRRPHTNFNASALAHLHTCFGGPLGVFPKNCRKESANFQETQFDTIQIRRHLDIRQDIYRDRVHIVLYRIRRPESCIYLPGFSEAPSQELTAFAERRHAAPAARRTTHQ